MCQTVALHLATEKKFILVGDYTAMKKIGCKGMRCVNQGSLRSISKWDQTNLSQLVHGPCKKHQPDHQPAQSSTMVKATGEKAVKDVIVQVGIVQCTPEASVGKVVAKDVDMAESFSVDKTESTSMQKRRRRLRAKAKARFESQGCRDISVSVVHSNCCNCASARLETLQVVLF